MSCQKDCANKHTHKTFYCDNCEPEMKVTMGMDFGFTPPSVEVKAGWYKGASFTMSCPECNEPILKGHVCPPNTTSVEGEYKRECEHTEMCHWKNCAECREFMLRKGWENELVKAREEERAKAWEEIETWLIENGVTHKECFVKMLKFVRSHADLITKIKTKYEKPFPLQL